MPRDVKIQSRRGTASEWTSVNPVLALGELGIETDTHKIKAGDDETHWDDLPYVTGPVDGDNVSLQVKRDTDANLSALTTPFLSGQLVYGQTTGKTVIGDGESLYDELSDLRKQFKNVVTVCKDGVKGDADFICSDSQWNSDDECIQAAIDYCATNNTELWIRGPDTYSITNNITGNHSITIRGIKTPIFNWTVQSSYMLSFSGSVLKTVNGTIDVPIGVTYLSVDDATNITPGMLILIYDNTNDWTTGYTGWKIGELHEVKSVDGNIITFHEGTLHKYLNTDGIKVQCITPITVNVDGIKLVGQSATDDYDLLQLSYNKDSIINNCTCNNAGTTSIRIFSSYNSFVSECAITNSERSGYGYGVAVANASAHIHVQNCNISACRHCIATGGSSSTPGQVRDFRVHDNTLYGTIRWAADAHAITESIYVYNNKIFSKNSYAFVSGAKYSEFKGNHVYGGYGVGIRGFVKDMVYIVEGNTFENCGFIFYDRHVYSDGENTEQYVSVQNNKVINALGALVDARYAQAISVSNNETKCTSSANDDAIVTIDTCDSNTGWLNYASHGGTINTISVENGRLKVVGTTSSDGKLSIKKYVDSNISSCNFISYQIESNSVGYPIFSIIDSSHTHTKSWARNHKLVANLNTKYTYNIDISGDIDIPQSPSYEDTGFTKDTIYLLIIGIFGAPASTEITFYIDNIYARTGTTYDNTGIYIDSAESAIVSNNQILTPYTIPAINCYNCTDLKLINNIGHKTENTGTATISTSQTSVTISHGLVSTPTRINVTPFGNIGSCWVDPASITSTQMTIHCSSAPEADTTVSWSAQVV